VTPLDVHDLGARPVRTLVLGRLDAGLHRIEWDGRNAAGQPMPGGVYLYRRHSETVSLTGKVMSLR